MRGAGTAICGTGGAILARLVAANTVPASGRSQRMTRVDAAPAVVVVAAVAALHAGIVAMARPCRVIGAAVPLAGRQRRDAAHATGDTHTAIRAVAAGVAAAIIAALLAGAITAPKRLFTAAIDRLVLAVAAAVGATDIDPERGVGAAHAGVGVARNVCRHAGVGTRRLGAVGQHALAQVQTAVAGPSGRSAAVGRPTLPVGTALLIVGAETAVTTASIRAARLAGAILWARCDRAFTRAQARGIGSGSAAVVALLVGMPTAAGPSRVPAQDKV